MRNETIKLNDEIIRAIERSLEKGNQVEVCLSKDGLKTREVKKKVIGEQRFERGE